MTTNTTKTPDEVLHKMFQPATYVNGCFVKRPAFEEATLTPDATIHTMDLMKQTISKEEFYHHHNDYLRGSLQAIQKHQFDSTYTSSLIDTVNWFIQKKPFPHSNTYNALLKCLTQAVSQKVEVPSKTQQEWTNALTRKSPICIPKDIGLIPENAVEPSFTYVKHFSKRSR